MVISLAIFWDINIMYLFVGILIGLLILLLATTFSESLVGSRTRILRTVGTVNDGDEIPSAAGMITSIPLFDYSYTWNDGVSERSCDECIDPNMCPKCPNVGATERIKPNPETVTERMTEGFDWRGIHPVNAEFIPDPLMSKSISKWGTEYPITGPYSGEILKDGRIYNQSSYLTHGVSNQPSIDFSSGMPYYMHPDTVDSVFDTTIDISSTGGAYQGDPEFWNSRACRGAGGQGSVRSGCKYTQSVAYLGTKNDDLFDGERALLLGTQRGTDYLPSTSVKLFNQSKNERTLANLTPWLSNLGFTEPRELVGAQGYIYKEPGMA